MDSERGRFFNKLLRAKRNIYSHGFKRFARFLDFIFFTLFACDIPSQIQYGDGTRFAHRGLGTVIHCKTTIGNNCLIYHGVTIGSRNGPHPPRIGNNVLIGAGAAIIGDVYIGDNSSVGANAVVMTDVPAGCIAVGVPAVIKEKKSVM